jgi:hypothetical protein
MRSTLILLALTSHVTQEDLLGGDNTVEPVSIMAVERLFFESPDQDLVKPPEQRRFEPFGRDNGSEMRLYMEGGRAGPRQEIMAQEIQSRMTTPYCLPIQGLGFRSLNSGSHRKKIELYRRTRSKLVRHFGRWGRFERLNRL